MDAEQPRLQLEASDMGRRSKQKLARIVLVSLFSFSLYIHKRAHTHRT